MKIILCLAVLCASLQLSAQSEKERSAIIRLYKDDIGKVYSVFFADTIEQTVDIKLKDDRGTVLLEQSMTGRGFSKRFSLADLKLGEYTFEVSIPDYTFREKIELKSEKQIKEESITLQNDYPSLYINVAEYNMKPMNIFVYTTDEQLLKMFYWEPNPKMPSKKIDISQFEGYEVRVQITQDGIDQVDQLVNLY
ncbi:hypothetical protein [Marinoscillum furvescens]|uniref:Uncharacterized protein n=1 Tax=Marinoscillum furvescens DSM 4134 TaxID=1122208 RepID=A0A3D9L2T0_MARFU|nr:hypothetical protein [Marinoscillum furvescens]RED99449.1 hypothetical protein C7460_10865 [Marinoscillum furvescens DSM 4134]